MTIRTVTVNKDKTDYKRTPLGILRFTFVLLAFLICIVQFLSMFNDNMLYYNALTFNQNDITKENNDQLKNNVSSIHNTSLIFQNDIKNEISNQENVSLSMPLSSLPTNITDGNMTVMNFPVGNDSTYAKVSAEPEIKIEEVLNHPHTGARYPNGSLGYIANVTYVRAKMIEQYYKQQYYKQHDNNHIPLISYLPMSKKELDHACNLRPGIGREGEKGYRLLTEKVKVVGVTMNENDSSITEKYRDIDIENGLGNRTTTKKSNKTIHGTTSTPSYINRDDEDDNNNTRILCVIYTHAKKNESIKAITETWGWRCDGFFAASTVTQEDIGSINLLHAGPEGYDNMWQKTRSILSYMYDHYFDDFDFFYICGDDTHLIVENLRAVIHSYGPDAIRLPFYFGHHIPGGGARNPNGKGKSNFYIGGGGGYILNRISLQILVEKGIMQWKPNSKLSAEDRMVGDALRINGIVGNVSVDFYGSQRFHGMDVAFVATYDGSRKNSRFFGRVYSYWASKWGFKAGLNLTSQGSLSFHLLKKPEWIKRHHAILYRSCPNGTLIGNDLKRVDKVSAEPEIKIEEVLNHPHAGARYLNGSLGYIANVTYVRAKMIEQYKLDQQINKNIPLISYLPMSIEDFDHACNLHPGKGQEEELGYKLISEKVKVVGVTMDASDASVARRYQENHINNTGSKNITINNSKDNSHRNQSLVLGHNRIIPGSTLSRYTNDSGNIIDTSNRSEGRILCAIYTHAKKNESIKAIAETWGWRCDGFFAASTVTQEDIGAINLVHAGPEAYYNMWQKTRSILSYMYDHYFDDFDFFYICGDDTHLIVENLRAVIHSYGQDAIQYPFYFGPNVPNGEKNYFVWGGGGYILNRLSLKVLVEKGIMQWWPNSYKSAEDRFVGNALRLNGIVGNISVDTYGAQRSHDSVHFVATYDGSWKRKHKYFYVIYKYWASKWGFKAGFNLVSQGSLTFHLLKKPEWIKRHHAILYRSCPNGTLIGDDLKRVDIG